MIERIREYSEKWWFKAFLGLIALTFVLLWGGGDLLNQVAGSRQTVATVGEARLTSWEFERVLNRELTHISRQVGRQVTREEALKGGLYQSVLTKLIDETLVEMEALRLGLSVSDQAVREAITQNPLFQTEGGTFNKENFLHLLSRLGYTESGFVEEMRRDMTRSRLFKALFQGVVFPKDQARFLYRWQEQTRQISYVLADFSHVQVTEQPTPFQLEAFFKEKENELRAPEFRDVTALVIDAEKMALSLEVTPEDLKKAYEERASDFEGQSFEQAKPTLERDLKQSRAVEKAYELGTKVEDMLAAGSTLEEVAKTFSLTLRPLKKVDQNGQPDLFQTKDGVAQDVTELDKAIAAEAFVLDPDVVGSLIEVNQTLFFVAQTSKVYPSQPRGLGDVHPQYAKSLWVQGQKRKKLLEIVDELRKSADNRGRLAIAANKHRVRLQSVKVSRQGAAIPSSLQLTPRLLETIFKAKRGEVVAGLLKRTPENPAFLVGVVESIHYPAEKGDSEAFKVFSDRLSEAQQEDFVKSYVASLRTRFTVNVNQRFMKEIEARSSAESL